MPALQPAHAAGAAAVAGVCDGSGGAQPVRRVRRRAHAQNAEVVRLRMRYVTASLAHQTDWSTFSHVGVGGGGDGT